MKLSHEVREELRRYDADKIDTFAKVTSILENKYDDKSQRDDTRKKSRNFQIDFRPNHTLESLKKLCQLLKRGYPDLSKKELLAQTIDTMMIRLEKKFRSLAERLREQKRDFENTSDLIHTVHGLLKDKTKYGYQRDVKDRNDSDVTCFNCKKKGHKKNQCKILRKKPSFGDKSDGKLIVRRIDICTGKGIIVSVSINQVNDLSAFFDPEQIKVGENQEWNVIGTGKTTLTLGNDFLKKTKGYEADYEKGTFKTIRGECVQLIRTQIGEEKELKNAIRRIAIVDEESAHLEAKFKDDHDYVFSKNEWDIEKCTVKAKEMCLVENKSFPKVVGYVNIPQKQSIINEFGKTVNFVSNARRRKKVIGYFLKRFKEWKKKSSALEIELRGIIMALNHYMDLLTGSRLTISCDHKPMSSFVKNSKCTKVIDILETINSFDIDIKYKNAASMKPADSLSRQYVRRIVLTENDKLITSRSDNGTLMKIFKSFHNNIGYLDYSRTISLLKLRINYDGIATNYINYLKSYEKCMAVNNKSYKNKVDMKIVTIKLPSEIV
uniref:CCHC-type domain-containing protein n=1 Tax=Strongyloides papillosus TaxID=174720 RepID=A0A0N5CAB7_STREA